jgi:hypothetical protein
MPKVTELVNGKRMPRNLGFLTEAINHLTTTVDLDAFIFNQQIRVFAQMRAKSFNGGSYK